MADALSHPPPAFAQQPPTAQSSSPTPTAEDWPKAGLVTPEQPILATFAKAQPVDFSAMAAAQRSCPEVTEMMNSTTLEITTQAVGDDSLLGDVLTGVFRPLVPIQHREGRFFSRYTPSTTPECGLPGASLLLVSAGHRWPRP